MGGKGKGDGWEEEGREGIRGRGRTKHGGDVEEEEEEVEEVEFAGRDGGAGVGVSVGGGGFGRGWHDGDRKGVGWRRGEGEWVMGRGIGR